MVESKVKSYKSYHLKTVLLELTSSKLYCTDGIHNNAYGFMKSLIKRLIEAYKERNLPNFFVPSQNLLEDEKDVQLITISLKKVLSFVNEIETFLTNIKKLNVSDFSVKDFSPELKTSINKEGHSIEDIISQFNSELISSCLPVYLYLVKYKFIVESVA